MLDEDEDTRLIADNPGYPVAVVPTQSSRTAEFSWVNNKITLGSKPVQTETSQSSTLNSADNDNKEYLCKHCNTEFANNDLLIKHLLELVAIAKKPVKRKIEKAKVPKDCELSKKTKLNDNIIKKKKNSEKNCTVRCQSQVKPSTSNDVQQTSSKNASSVSVNIFNKNSKVRFDRDNKNTERVEKSYIYKCKECNIYFGNKHQMKQHKVYVHPDLADMFVKLPTTSILKKNKTENKVLNVKAKKVTAPKKERSHKNEQSSDKIISYRPEVKESLSMQNKVGPSWQHDTVNQTQVVANPTYKKITISKPVPKNKSMKKIQKVTTLNKHDQTHSTVRVVNSEKTELFRSSCGLHFITCKSLQKHSDVCNGSCNTQKINCKKCGYMFSSDTLSIHQFKHHNNNQINIFDIIELSQKHKILQCITCTQKFAYKKSYQSHVLKCRYKIRTQNISNLKMLHKCVQCNIHYKTRAGLKEHLKKNHLIRYAIKKCDDCNILLSNRSFHHHIQIHHDLFECELKDLTIKYNDNKDDNMQTINSTAKTKTIKTAGHLLSSTNNSSFDKKNINESLIDSTESNIPSTKEAKDKNILIANKIGKTLTPTDILPNVLYKCNKCKIHFVTNVAHNDHLSSKNCHYNESDIGKCPKCHLMFYAENVIEHLANQHFNKSKTSNDFLIICNDTVEIQSHSKETGYDNEKHKQTTKRLNDQNCNVEAASVRQTSGTNIPNVDVYDKTESMKLFAEAWLRNKCAEAASFASIDSTNYSNFLYRCPKCALNFLNYGRLKLHVFECKGDNCDWAQCPICCYSFSISSLSLHIYVHHAKMELKRENFVISSAELSTDSLEPVNNHTHKKLSATKENENKQVQELSSQSKKILVFNSSLNNTEVTDDTRKAMTQVEKCIDSNSPDIIDLVSSLETNDSQTIDDTTKEAIVAQKYTDTNIKTPDVIDLVSSQETKSIVVTDFKSSRDKIAWAIDSIENSNKCDANKSPQRLNEKVNEIFKEYVTTTNTGKMSNDTTLIQMLTKKDETSNQVEKDVSEEIDSILSALDGNNRALIEVDSNQITDTRADIQTNKVFEDIDSLVASFENNSRAIKLKEQNIILYKCNICCIHFMTSKSLQIHILNGIHDKDPGMNCNICQLTFNKHTVTRHITKHHENMNMIPLNYIIKTDYRADNTIKRQRVVSDFFKKKQLNENVLKYAKNMLGLTRKQKSSLCKVLKKSTKNNISTSEALDLPNQTQNPCDKNEKHQDLVNNYVNEGLHQQHNESNKDKFLINSNNSTLVQTLNRNLEIIDLCNSQNSEVGGDVVTDLAPPQLICTNNAKSLYKRKFSVDSNVANYKKITKVTKNRTKSEDQRKSKSYTDAVTNQSYDFSKIVTININTGPGDKTKKSSTTVTEKLNSSNDKSDLMVPSHFRFNGVDIMPINSKVNANINSKVKRNSIVHGTSTKSLSDKNQIAKNSNTNSLEASEENNISTHTIAAPRPLSMSNVVSLESIDILDGTTKRQNNNTAFGEPTIMPKTSTVSKDMSMTLDDARERDVFLRQNYQEYKRVNGNIKPHSPVQTDSCNKKPENSRRSVITFEDSNFKIRTSYENDNNENTSAAEKINTENKNQDTKRDGKFSSNITTPLRRGSSNAHRKDPVDIIDITEETNDNNIYMPGTDRTKNFSSEHSKSPNIVVEKNVGAFDYVQNRRISAPTIGAGMPNTPMALPTTPNFNLFNFMNNPLFHYLSFPFHQQSPFNINTYPNHTKPKQNRKRMPKNPNAPSAPTIFDNMQSCPICRYSNVKSSVKKHLRVRKGFFSCCFCARKSTEMQLSNHIQMCSSQINFNPA